MNSLRQRCIPAHIHRYHMYTPVRIHTDTCGNSTYPHSYIDTTCTYQYTYTQIHVSYSSVVHRSTTTSSITDSSTSYIPVLPFLLNLLYVPKSLELIVMYVSRLRSSPCSNTERQLSNFLIARHLVKQSLGLRLPGI